jgi:hypothetical protein
MNIKNYILFYFSIVVSAMAGCNSAEPEPNTTSAVVIKKSECNCQDLFLDDLYSHFYLEDRTKPYTGHCTGLDENGILSIEKEYVKGKLHGTVIKYYENGNIKEETEFDINFQHGESKKYDESGQLIFHREYHKGEFKRNLLQ